MDDKGSLVSSKDSLNDLHLGPEWSYYTENDYYIAVIEYKLYGRVSRRETLDESTQKMFKKEANRVIIVDYSETIPPKPHQLAYLERNGSKALCIVEADLPTWLHTLHNIYGHWSERIMVSRSVGVVWWPSRSKDIVKYCRSCPQCQFVGPLRPSRGLLPILFMQPMDCIGIDYIGPFTPIAKSRARYVIIAVDYFSRYIFACPV